MATSRRNFLKHGTMGAVAAGVTLSLSDAAVGRQVTVTPEPIPDRGAFLNRAAFESQINTTFLIGPKDREVAVKLIQVGNLGTRKTGSDMREAFSLVFCGNNASPLDQNTYQIQHKKLGDFTFLVVPIVSSDQTQRYYEAVVNRLHG